MVQWGVWNSLDGCWSDHTKGQDFPWHVELELNLSLESSWMLQDEVFDLTSLLSPCTVSIPSTRTPSLVVTVRKLPSKQAVNVRSHQASGAVNWVTVCLWLSCILCGCEVMVHLLDKGMLKCLSEELAEPSLFPCPHPAWVLC